MNCIPPRLTDEEIRTKYFLLHPVGLLLAFGREMLNYAEKQRQRADAQGGRFDVIAWPDGTTVMWTRRHKDNELDLDALVILYHASRDGQEMAQEHQK